MTKINSNTILIISDIHANLEAFRAVLRHSGNFHSETWILGDIVGYGPNPRECLELAREMNARIIVGNHDLAVSGKIDTRDFNEIARTVIMKHRDELKDEEKEFLGNLPTHLRENYVTMAHGSPRNPVWEYVRNTETAIEILNQAQSSITLVGHSHLTLLWTKKNNSSIQQEIIEPDRIYDIKGQMALANPGSVGQSRNGDKEAHYILLNLAQKKLSFHSCSWNRGKTRQKMLHKGYPRQLIEFMAPE